MVVGSDRRLVAPVETPVTNRIPPKFRTSWCYPLHSVRFAGLRPASGREKMPLRNSGRLVLVTAGFTWTVRILSVWTPEVCVVRNTVRPATQTYLDVWLQKEVKLELQLP